MKKILLLTLVVFVFTSVQSQLFKVGKYEFGFLFAGPKLGGNIATSSFNDPGGNNTITNFGQQFGVVAKLGITDKLSIQPELVYTSKGFGIDNSGIVSNANYNYIGLPIAAKYAFLAISGVQIYGSGGFYTDVLTSVKTVVLAPDSLGGRFEFQESLETYNRIDFGLNFGGGANFKLNSGDRLNIDLGMTYGFVNTDNSGFVSSSKNITVQLSALYLFDITRFLRSNQEKENSDQFALHRKHSYH